MPEINLRKIDALVAEKVMGWQTRWTERTRQKRPLGSFRLWVKHSSTWSVCPYFTVSHHDFVRRAMAECGFTGTLQVSPGGVIAAEFKHVDGRYGWYCCDRPFGEGLVTAMAALDALGVEVPERV